MKKKTLFRTITIAGTLAGVITGIVSKNKTCKTIGYSVAGLGSTYLIAETFLDEKKKMRKEMNEYETFVENSKIVPEIIQVNKLNDKEISESDKLHKTIPGILFREIYKQTIFEDDMIIPKINEKGLEWNMDKTIHVIKKNGNKITVAIPIQKNTSGMSYRVAREAVENLVRTFSEQNNLKFETDDADTNVFIQGIEISKNIRNEETNEIEESNFTYYHEIDRRGSKETEDLESWNKYSERVYSYKNLFGTDKQFTELSKVNGTLGYEVFIEVNFPNTLTTARLLSFIKMIMEGIEYKSEKTGRSGMYEFEHILFHPEQYYDSLIMFESEDSTELIAIDL